MSTGGRRLRTIREDHSYGECVERLGGYGLVDELTGHLKWRLARDPFFWSFRLKPERETRVTFTEELRDDVPVLRVFFVVVNDDLLSLLWVEEAEDAPVLGFDDWLPL